MSKTGRCPDYDYTLPGIYLITFSKAPTALAFGSVAGDARIAPGLPGAARIDLSPLGKRIKNAVWDLPFLDWRLRSLQYAVMPDHVHIVLEVREKLEEHLGRYLARFKVQFKGVFKEKYNDQILHPGRSLEVLIRYVRENPHRLAIRRQFPDFFRRVRNIVFPDMEVVYDGVPRRLKDMTLEGYGNFFLLKNPLMTVVGIHTRWSDLELADHVRQWERVAEKGGILISPFIHPEEKRIMARCLEFGAKVIKIQPQPFGKDWRKPQGAEFHLCEAGRLLLLAPKQSSPLSYAYCHELNAMAQAIASNPEVVVARK